jgi:spore coat protein CotH
VLTWDLNLALNGDPAQGPYDAGRMGRGPGGGFGGGFRQGNQLKERFLAAAAFKPRYEKAYRDLYRKLYASGAALAAVDRASTALKAAGASASTVDGDATNLRTLIDARTKSLSTNAVITGR